MDRKVGFGVAGGVFGYGTAPDASAPAPYAPPAPSAVYIPPSYATGPAPVRAPYIAAYGAVDTTTAGGAGGGGIRNDPPVSGPSPIAAYGAQQIAQSPIVSLGAQTPGAPGTGAEMGRRDPRLPDFSYLQDTNTYVPPPNGQPPPIWAPDYPQYPQGPFYPSPPCGGGGGGGGGGGLGATNDGIGGASQSPNGPQKFWIDPLIQGAETTKYYRGSYITSPQAPFEFGAYIYKGACRLLSLEAILNPVWVTTIGGSVPVWLLICDSVDVAGPSNITPSASALIRTIGPFQASTIVLWEPFGEDMFTFTAPDGSVRRVAGGYPFDNGIAVFASYSPGFYTAVTPNPAITNSVLGGPAAFHLSARVQVPIS